MAISKMRRSMRILRGSTVLVLSESMLFGLSVLPALLFWQFIVSSTKGFPLLDPYGRYVLVAMSLMPAYLIFGASLMFLNAGWCKLVGWRTEAGEYPIYDYDKRVVRWASYNASISVVRIFCGEALRSTPIWTYYLKANGAKIGKNVYVNSARLNDHNLLVFEDKSVVGGDAKLIAHLAENGKIKAEPVILRRKAVVGVNTVIGPGVEVGEGSAVGAMSFVPKGTKIPPNEVWGGVPARCIKRYEEKHKQPGIPITY